MILASDLLATGDLTTRELARRYSMVFPNVYVHKGTVLNAATRTQAAWLASGRRGVMVGQSAAVLHGSRWVPDTAPAERLGDHNRRAVGLIVHSGKVPDHELSLQLWDGIVACMQVPGFWELKRTRTERPDVGAPPTL